LEGSWRSSDHLAGLHGERQERKGEGEGKRQEVSPAIEGQGSEGWKGEKRGKRKGEKEGRGRVKGRESNVVG